MNSNEFKLHQNKNISYYFEVNTNLDITEVDTKSIVTSTQCTIVYKNISDNNITLSFPNREEYISLSPNPVVLKPTQHLRAIIKGDGLLRHIELILQDESQLTTAEPYIEITNNPSPIDSSQGSRLVHFISNASTISVDLTQGTSSIVSIQIDGEDYLNGNQLPESIWKNRDYEGDIQIYFTENTGLTDLQHKYITTANLDSKNVTTDFTIIQSTRDSVFSSSRPVVSFENIGGTDVSTITSSIGSRFLSYSISSKPDWITPSILGNELTLLAEANESVTRSGQVILLQSETNKTLTIQVSQAAVELEFSTNILEKTYPVSKDGLGFDIEDNDIQITSYVNGTFRDFNIVSKPEWVKSITKGTRIGNVTTLNIIVLRNKTSDDTISGNIILSQVNTPNTITLNVTQLGRLVDGLPREYPYITNENIIDRYYQVWDEANPENNTYRDLEKPHLVAQVGRQRWLAQDVRVSDSNQEGDLDITQSYQMQDPPYSVWLNDFPYAREYDWVKYNTEIAGRNFRGQFAQRIVEQGLFNSWQRGFNENHHVVTFDEFKELMGFIVAYFWDGTSNLYDTNYIKRITGGTTLMKLIKNTELDGYDEDRRVYIDGINSDLVQHGTDNFGLSFHSNVIYNNINPTVNDGEHLSRIMIAITLMLGDFIDHNNTGSGSETNRGYHRDMVYGKSLPSPWDVPTPANKNKGWKAGEEFTGFIGKSFRSVRNVDLPYNLYTNNTDSIIKVNNGSAIPEGYTLVPKGALAGAYFAKPEYTYAQLSNVSGFINWQIGALDGNPEAKPEMIG